MPLSEPRWYTSPRLWLWTQLLALVFAAWITTSTANTLIGNQQRADEARRASENFSRTVEARIDHELGYLSLHTLRWPHDDRTLQRYAEEFREVAPSESDRIDRYLEAARDPSPDEDWWHALLEETFPSDRNAVTYSSEAVWWNQRALYVALAVGGATIALTIIGRHAFARERSMAES